MDLVDKELSYKIRGAVFEVSRNLGPGFLEKIYEKALMIELADAGLKADDQSPVTINYKGRTIGEYVTDIMVEDRILIEIKAQQSIRPEHRAQLLNYLKATGLKLGFLVNFTYPKAKIERFII